MNLEVRFELGKDDDVADDTKETGIMIAVGTGPAHPLFGAMPAATIVLRSGKVVQRPLAGIEVIDSGIREKLDAIKERADKIGVEVDVND